MALYGEFASDGDRHVATKRMTNKRATLEVEARQMADSGVPFKASELPRSFRSEESPDEPEAAEGPEAEESVTAVVLDSVQKTTPESTFAGTSLGVQKLLLAYKRQKEKKGISAE